MAITINNSAQAVVDGVNSGHVLDAVRNISARSAEIKAAFDIWHGDRVALILAGGGIAALRDARKAARIAELNAAILDQQTQLAIVQAS